MEFIPNIRHQAAAKTQAPWPFSSHPKTWVEKPWLWRGLYAAVGVGALAALAKLALSQRGALDAFWLAHNEENTDNIQSRSTLGNLTSTSSTDSQHRPARRHLRPDSTISLTPGPTIAQLPGDGSSGYDPAEHGRELFKNQGHGYY